MRSIRLSLLFTAIVSIVCGFPLRAVAWGPKGHEIVGRVADQLLTSDARHAIDLILQSGQFSSLSDGRLTNWADSIKRSSFYNHRYPNNDKWHFIDIDVTANLSQISLDSFCGGGDCISNKVEQFRGKLNSNGLSDQDRREALYFVAHFLGDLSQPLHCAERNGDRGGNAVNVHLPGDSHHSLNLHRTWDTELVEEAIGSLSLADYSNRLVGNLSSSQRAQYEQGKIADWILESHKIAREKAYFDNNVEIPLTGIHSLSPAYISDRSKIVETQLTKGGVRLAKVLNDAFAP